jgi:hypothetical protein
MARRAANDNYESDIEEEEAAAQQQQQQDEAAGGEEATAALRVLADTEKKLKELQEQEERLKVGLVQPATASHSTVLCSAVPPVVAPILTVAVAVCAHRTKV